VAELLKGTFRALRAAAKRWMWVEECLVALGGHFIATHMHLLEKARTLQQRVRAPDRHFCQVPRCSRAAAHAHHILPRSQGGPDDDWNLVSLCAAHHLFGIHGGRIRVTGRRRMSWSGNSGCGGAVRRRRCRDRGGHPASERPSLDTTVSLQ